MTIERQPAPVPGQEVVLFHVLDDLKRRAEYGRQPENYGRYLETFNGRSQLQDLYEELLDGAMFCKALILEMDVRSQQQYQVEFESDMRKLAK